MSAACPDQAVLRQLARGRVSVFAERELDRHLAACPPCADTHDAFLTPVAQAVRRFAADPDLPSPDRLIARVRALRGPDATPSNSVSTDDPVADAASRTAVAVGRSTTELPTYRADEPDRLGKFVIRGRLGSGGMGDVFRAEDDTLHREVALKLLQVPGGVTPTPGERRRLIEEARAAARVEHPHIVRVYEVGEAGDVPYIAMELLRGETLADRLKRDKAVPPAEVCRLGAQMAEGLAAAHAAGLVHRDIKPGNLWLEPGRGGLVVRILDFGLARGGAPTDPDAAPSAVLVSSRAGTPAYMSPEQAAGHELDARSDLFSLGLVLYELTAGRRLIAGARTSEVLATVSGFHPPPVEKLLPGAPPKLASLVACLLVNDRARRTPATAREVADQLGALAARYARRRNPVVWAVGAAFLFIALVVMGQVVIRIQRNEKDPGVELSAPAGSRVAISPDGQATITLPPGPAQLIPPAYTGPTLDHLRRDRIPLEHLKIMGQGDANAVLPEVVGFVGHPTPDKSHPDAGDTEAVLGLTLHPDGKTLVTLSGSGTARVWNLSAPAPVVVRAVRVTDQPQTARAMAMTAGGDRVAIGDASKRVAVWAVPELRRLLAADADEEPLSLAWNPAGDRLAVGSAGQTARVLKADSLATVGVTEMSRSRIGAVRFVHGGRTLIAGGRGELRATDVTSKSEVLHQYENGIWFSTLALSADGRWLATNGGVNPFNPKTIVPLVVPFVDNPARGVRTDRNVVRVRDITTSFSCQPPLGHPDVEVKGDRATDRVTHSAFSPDGKRLATLTEHNRVTVWDWAAGRSLWTTVIRFNPPGEVDAYGLRELVYHNDGNHLIVATKNGYALILRIPAGR